MAVFSNPASEPTQEPETNLTAVFETARAFVWDAVTQTALVLPTATLEPTSTLIPLTETMPPTSLSTAMLEQVVAWPPSVASCVPTGTTHEEGLVVGIVDGDTIDVSIGDKTYRVRYIGVDTPETDEAFYWQATGENQTLVYAKQVTLVKDISETDRYGRLLRYVFVGDTFVNYELVRKGFASAATYPPDVACASYFSSTQSQANTEQVGLWAPVATVIPITSGGGVDSLGGGMVGSTGNCHPSYPDVCIPPPPPDLNCRDVPYKKFRVLPPDPHNFDGNNDGVGCEG